MTSDLQTSRLSSCRLNLVRILLLCLHHHVITPCHRLILGRVRLACASGNTLDDRVEIGRRKVHDRVSRSRHAIFALVPVCEWWQRDSVLSRFE